MTMTTTETEMDPAESEHQARRKRDKKLEPGTHMHTRGVKKRYGNWKTQAVCDPDNTQAGGRAARAAKKLAARQKDFEDSKLDGKSGYHRPGSLKAR